MTGAILRVPGPWLAAVVVLLVSSASGCDDAPQPKPNDRKSVMEGGKPETEAGRKLENAKQKIDGAEKQLEDRDDRVFEQSQGEQAGRGVP